MQVIYPLSEKPHKDPPFSLQKELQTNNSLVNKYLTVTFKQNLNTYQLLMRVQVKRLLITFL